MKISELVFPSTSPKIRPGMHQYSTLPIEKIIDYVNRLYQEGKDNKTVFTMVRQEFGPDAKAYVVRNIAAMVAGSMVNEEFWAYPSKIEQMKKLKVILAKPVSPEDAKTVLLKVLSSKQLFDTLDALGKDEDATPIIVDYIKAQFPNLNRELSKGDRDCINDCDGNLSPLGHDVAEKR